MVSLYWQGQLLVFPADGVHAAKQHSRHLLGLRMLRYLVAYGLVSFAATQPRFRRPKTSCWRADRPTRHSVHQGPNPSASAELCTLKRLPEIPTVPANRPSRGSVLYHAQAPRRPFLPSHPTFRPSALLAIPAGPISAIQLCA
jgi:hypothetical protein